MRSIASSAAGVALWCWILFQGNIDAAIPQLVNFQAQLRDGAGNPVADASYAVTFTIYDAASGGSALWSETRSVATTGGLFSVLLGTATAGNEIPDGVFESPDRWVGIQVGGDPEMTPRQRMVSVPYAYRTSSVDGALGGSLGGTLSFGNSAAPLLYMYESGVTNPARSLFAHSPAFPDWGLAYDDATDRMTFQAGGIPVLTADLGLLRVGVGTGSPSRPLHVLGGSDLFVARVESGNTGGTVTEFSNTSSGSVWEYAVAGSAGAFAGTVGSGNLYIYRQGTSAPALQIGTANQVAIGSTPVFAGARLSVQSSNNPGATAIDGTSNASYGFGIAGYATNGTGIGVYGHNLAGFAGYFIGSTYVQGDLGVSGTLFKGAGAFKIDHPTDPENKYLYHSFVESPDMKNIYDGVITTDSDGQAVVELPDWFEALNRDFRYQLTVIGQFAQAIVSRELADNRFSIRTDRPNVKVSWQVTGIRQDAFADAHRIPVEEAKPDRERGLYLHPEVFGRPPERGVGQALHRDGLRSAGAPATRVSRP